MITKVTASAKLYILTFTAVASLIGLGLYGIKDMGKMNDDTRTLYADRVLCMRQLANVRFEYLGEVLPMALNAKNKLVIFDEARKRVRDAKAAIDINWNNYKLSYLTGEEKLLVDETDILKKQADNTIESLETALSKKDMGALDTLIKKQPPSIVPPFVTKITQLMDLQVKVGSEVSNNSQRIYQQSSKNFFLLILLSLTILLLLSFYIIKNIKDLINDILQSRNIYKESEERYRSLLENASDAIYLVDDKGNFAEVNESMCGMTGYSREELLKLNIEQLVDPEQLKTDPVIHGYLDPDKPVIRERRLVRKDGEVFDVEINVKRFAEKKNMVIARDITGRKRMEADLREAELKFRTLAEKSMVGIYISQKEKFTYVNPRFAEIFGYKPEEIIDAPGSAIDIIISKEEQATVREKIYNRYRGVSDNAHYDVKGMRKDGSHNYVEFFGSRVITNGEPSIIGTMIDITERRKAEEELRSSEQKYKLLFDSNPQALWMIAKDDFTIISINEAAAKLYGYTKEELLYKNITILRPAEDRDQLPAIFDKDFTDSHDVGFIKQVKKDGSIMYVHIIAHDIVFEGRKVRLSLTTDVTERLKAQENLQKSEANLRAIMDTTDTAYVLLDTQLNVVTFNYVAVRLLNVQLSNFPKEGGSIVDLIPPERLPQFRRYSEDVLKGKNISYEVNYLLADSSIGFFSVRMFPIKNAENEIFGMLVEVSDITEIKKYTNAIEEQNKMFKEIAWLQSHIVRAPLARMMGIANLIKDNDLDIEENKEFLQHLSTSADELDTIIKDITAKANEVKMKVL